MLYKRFCRRLIAGLAFVNTVFAPVLVAGQAKPETIPDFSTFDYGWLKDGQAFHAPASGIGPISYDKAHPIMRTAPNNRGVAVTAPLRVADLSNPILKPWVVERMKKDNDEVIAGKIRYNPRSYCMPTGVPHFLIYGGLEPLYFAQTPKETLIINQADTQVRHVYMNVPHSKEPKPSYYGESVGHYEGDELVVDTIGLSEKPALDEYGTPHTTQLHVIERYKMVDGGKTLQVALTVEDPGAFNAPWSAIAVYHRSPSVLQLTEEPCAENNFGHPGNEFEIPVANTPDF
jgi:hypothetical protein